MTAGLVPIGDGDFPVDARNLHRALGVRKKYADWIKTQITGARMDRGQDFEAGFSPTGEKGGRPAVEHFLTLTAAKKVAMMSGTAKGDQVRDYFLECEGVALAATSPKTPAEIIAQGWKLLEAQVAEERAGRLLAESVAENRRPAQEWAEDVATGDGLVETRVALRLASVPGAIRLTRAMWSDLDAVYFTREAGERCFRSWCTDLGIGEDVPTTVVKGCKRVLVSVPKWTPKGWRHLRERLLENRRQKRIGATA